MSVLATAGHVDHGKSALIQALTGHNPDRLPDERRRGLTIDLGFAHTTLPSARPVSFVDVPGHRRFLPNMLAGVGAVDGCLFVVDAAEGWRAQSEEHLRIVDLFGVPGGVVALTKCDLVTAAQAASVAADVRARLTGTTFAGAEIIPVSARAGTGLDALRAALDRLVDPERPGKPRRETGRARLWIDRSFHVRGAGTVVTGTTDGAGISIGDHLVVEPGSVPVRVRGVQVRDIPVDRVGSRDRAALNLVGANRSVLRRGHVVVAPDRWHLTDRFDAGLDVLSSVEHPVDRRGAYVAYIGTGEFPVRLSVVSQQRINPGTSGAVRLQLPTRIPLLPGDRYVLRESGREATVGGGEVLDVAPVLPVSRAAPDRRWQRVVAERGWVRTDELERLTGVSVAPTVGNWVGDRAAAGPAPEERPSGGTPTPNDGPVVEQLRQAGMSPGPPSAPAAVLQRLRLAGLLVHRDGVWFHADAVGAARLVAARLLANASDGFTVSEFCRSAGISRKFGLPLLAELDARGVTRRRDDRRHPGPRLLC